MTRRASHARGGTRSDHAKAERLILKAAAAVALRTAEARLTGWPWARLALRCRVRSSPYAAASEASACSVLASSSASVTGAGSVGCRDGTSSARSPTTR